MKRFRLEYMIDITIDVDSLWPDGDAPANPSAADVATLIKRCGGWRRIVDDWNLADDPSPRITEVAS